MAQPGPGNLMAPGDTKNLTTIKKLVFLQYIILTCIDPY